MIVFFMLTYTAYKRSFKNLIEVFKENKELTARSNDIASKSENLELLAMEIASYDKYLGNQNIARDIVQQEVIAFSTQHQGISINDLQAIHMFEGENYSIYTNQLDVTGNINDLMRLAYDFETKFNFSRVVSTNYYTVKKNNKNEILHLKILFQNYEMKSKK
ncbi:hypothetical protein FIA58_017150 [Flavobacterium jejuense]|uniref:Uncharacterized protein n=2 Tax=Flavobacterium jejuense TaxID=1544455 RepID=A0ABX0IU34_9FLAO|nr:hypothetical protein [Flavobacterium jejuense]